MLVVAAERLMAVVMENFRGQFFCLQLSMLLPTTLLVLIDSAFNFPCYACC